MGQRLPGYRLQTIFGSPEQNFGLPSLLPKQQFIYFSTERSINIDFIFSVTLWVFSNPCNVYSPLFILRASR